MRETVSKLNSLLGKYLVILMVIMVATGYLFPWRDNRYQTILAIIIFGFISFASSTSTNLTTFVNQVKKPFVSLYMIVLVHLACPVVAWALGMLFYPGNFNMRSAFLVSACVPMASSCLVWTAMSGGSISLTILTLSIEAFAAPLLIPLCLWLVLGKSVELNYMNMILQLLFMVTIPSLAGMLMRDRIGEKKMDLASDPLNLVAKIFMLALVYINCSASFEGFVIGPGVLKMVLVFFLFVLCNYTIGYFGMSLIKNRTWPERISSIFCCGLRNNGFGQIIAVTYFSPAVGVPLAISIIVQQPIAGILSHFLVEYKDKLEALSKASQSEG